MPPPAATPAAKKGFRPPVQHDPGSRLLTRDEQAKALADNEAMTWYLARRWGSPRGITGERLEDLAAEIRAGFVLAATRFRPDMGYKFGTYATWYGRDAAMKWLLRELAGGLHVPRNHGITPVTVLSLDTPADDYRSQYHVGGSPRTWAEHTADRKPADPTAIDDAAAWWASALRTLPERWARFVTMYYREGLTLVEIATRERLSRERARQIIANGLKRLRETRPDLDDGWPWTAGAQALHRRRMK
jgi:RNA polymerase sigma factor (sigma-70 family)